MSQQVYFELREVEHEQLPHKLQPGKKWKESVPHLVYRGKDSGGAGTPVLEVVAPATDEHKKRFPAEWEAFEKSQKPVEEKPAEEEKPKKKGLFSKKSDDLEPGDSVA